MAPAAVAFCPGRSNTARLRSPFVWGGVPSSPFVHALAVSSFAPWTIVTVPYAIEINFEQFPDPKEREYFLNLPTSFSLDDHQVDCLIAGGRKLLRSSERYQALLRELGGSLLPSVGPSAEFPAGGCRAAP